MHPSLPVPVASNVPPQRRERLGKGALASWLLLLRRAHRRYAHPAVMCRSEAGHVSTHAASWSVRAQPSPTAQAVQTAQTAQAAQSEQNEQAAPAAQASQALDPGLAPSLSIVMPALDEAACIVATLQALQELRVRGVELVLADGGSSDGTLALAAPLVDRCLVAPRGRAAQMNAGAAAARGAALLFLHADTRLPPHADAAVLQALQAGACWGRFDVHIDGRPWMLRVVAALMNLRSRCTGIATGDQAIFVTRVAFEAAGGFPLQPLMEDIEISRRLKRIGRPACLRPRASTSGRRWEQRGVWRTIVLMWRLRWRYWRGESAASLARAYR